MLVLEPIHVEHSKDVSQITGPGDEQKSDDTSQSFEVSEKVISFQQS